MLWRLSTKFLGLLVRTTNAPLARIVWFACFGRSRLVLQVIPVDPCWVRW
jgi:hypothetical protein